eukprot:gnl/TRDRNA2_/TRDRNA2_170522_c3_seq6.p1 gnl/TRDRNA2_/TRDRNA2_170522_c3~~gnl/TRDRNA2_/TRDRNA2_170522_c3_seq6.p1  ORF type:complete len:185 (+),score=58.22 gnl/TRDRNA2_/TRDRNA2_170522_c3_seq6:53-556(+)
MEANLEESKEKITRHTDQCCADIRRLSRHLAETREKEALTQASEKVLLDRLEALEAGRSETTRVVDALIEDAVSLGNRLDELANKSEAADAASAKADQESVQKLQEAVTQLEAHVDGGFDAIVVKLETERWMRTNVDAVADSITNQFLQLVDMRVQRVEEKLAATGS